MRRPLALALVLAACAAAGKEGAGGPEGPDADALKTETRVKARSVTIVLGEQWRAALEVEALRVERPAPDRILARGAATLRLRGLRVEAADSIEVTFLADHRDFLLHAKGVERFEQKAGYGHRTENVDAVTMANDRVSIFQQ